MMSKSGLLSPSRSCQRLLLVSVLVLFPLTVLLLLAGGGDGNSMLPLPGLYQDDKQVFTPKIGRCSHGERAAWASEWNVTERNHRDLLDDRFTSKELQRTLDILLGQKIPSLLEIVVIWNNVDQEPPASHVSAHGVDVRYRRRARNSLNEKLWDDPSYRTRGVLLSDDDVFYRPADLEFVFQMWRRFGRDRVTGALARCARVGGPDGAWRYDFCRPGGRYALVLTNLAFVDVSVLDAYNSGFAPVAEMRAYVDEHFNCEDIALNFVAAARMTTPDSRATSVGGPLLVRGSEQYVNLDPSGGINRKGGHMEARSECLNRFAKAFGCMPLVDEVARIEYGVKHNVWYKSLADRLRQQ
ncbi:hypothetical protein PWT90_01115 [Aphanocladium album]|nr:hypothetical protein PWT90_01115 [Aphanocladium album]